MLAAMPPCLRIVCSQQICIMFQLQNQTRGFTRDLMCFGGFFFMHFISDFNKVLLRASDSTNTDVPDLFMY